MTDLAISADDHAGEQLEHDWSGWAELRAGITVGAAMRVRGEPCTVTAINEPGDGPAEYVIEPMFGGGDRLATFYPERYIDPTALQPPAIYSEPAVYGEPPTAAADQDPATLEPPAAAAPGRRRRRLEPAAFLALALAGVKVGRAVRELIDTYQAITSGVV